VIRQSTLSTDEKETTEQHERHRNLYRSFLTGDEVLHLMRLRICFIGDFRFKEKKQYEFDSRSHNERIWITCRHGGRCSDGRPYYVRRFRYQGNTQGLLRQASRREYLEQSPKQLGTSD